MGGKNNPFRTTARDMEPSSRRRSQVANTSGYQGRSTKSAQVCAGVLSRNECASPMNVDQDTYYSSGRVQQWAADSRRGLCALTQQSSGSPNGTSLDVTNSQAMLCAGEAVPGSFSFPHFDASHVSLPVSNGPYQAVDFTTGLSLPSLYSAAGESASGLTVPFDFQGTPASNFDATPGNAWAVTGAQTISMSGLPIDDSYTDHTDLSYAFGGNQDSTFEYLGPWSCDPMAALDSSTGVGEAASMNAMLSPLSSVTADLSVSSSHSPASLLAPTSTSPLSFITQGEEHGLEASIVRDDGCRSSQRFAIGDAVFAAMPSDYMREPRTLPRSAETAISPSDSGTVTEGICRTLRPSGATQRPIVPASGPVAPVHQFGEMYIVPPAGDGMRRRSTGEVDPAPAREHELYQALPRDDGLYHCPYEGQDSCTHKPTKLKCNYDKNVDSHLKPYRCKILACGDTRFSSTACLLRHEREAHGMHGHGAKPHLCTYEDCERSIPGNGFPRRWNLYDHMRRMHDYTGAPSSNGSASPALSSSSSQCPGTAVQTVRKRKTSAASDTQPPRKQKPVAMVRSRSDMRRLPTSRDTQDKQLQNMKKEWKDHQSRVRERMDGLQNPDDLLSLDQITADMAVLRTIAMNIRRLRAGQLANGDTRYGPG